MSEAAGALALGDQLVNQETRQTARRYRTIRIHAGRQTITAADPLPDELRQALDAINYDGRSVH